MPTIREHGRRSRETQALLSTALALLTAQGWTFTSIPAAGLAAKFSFSAPDGRQGIANVRSSTERYLSGIWLHNKNRWQTLPQVDVIIVATYVTAYEPASGVQVFAFSPTECMTALDAKRALNPSAQAPTFVQLDPAADKPGAGLATLRPPIASGPVLPPENAEAGHEAPEISGAAFNRQQPTRLQLALNETALAASEEYGQPVDRIRVSIGVMFPSGEVVMHWDPQAS